MAEELAGQLAKRYIRNVEKSGKDQIYTIFDLFSSNCSAGSEAIVGLNAANWEQIVLNYETADELSGRE